MTAQEIRDAISASPGLQSMLAAGNYEGVAATLNAAAPDVLRSLGVDEMFDVLFASGDYATLKTAQLAGDARAVFAFATLADALTLGPGKVNLALPTTIELLNSLQTEPVLLTPAGRAALTAAATTRPTPIDWRAVLDATRTP